MRRFQFSLQAALVMRERSVESAENAQRIVQEEWNVNQRKQQDLLDEVHRAETALLAGPIDPADFIAVDKFRTVSHPRRLRLAQESNTIAKRLAERRAAWQKAERDRTLLIRLKEKALSRWQIDYDKEQQQLAEEAYLSRWGARSR